MKAILPLTFLVFTCSPGWAKDRYYYVGIKETTWNYIPTGKNMLTGKPISEDQDAQIYGQRSHNRIGSVYKKALYFQYTDDTFQTIIEKPSWLGYLGPIIKAETGDYIYVHVKNFASRMYSFHPHGASYTKENEGALYPDNTTGLQRADDRLPPGGQYIYKWFVDEKQGPGPNDTSCVTRMYHSHVDSPKDLDSGPVGVLLTCKRGTLDEDIEKDVDKSYILMFFQTDENNSWYIDDNINTYTEPGQVDASDSAFRRSNIMASINGYMYGNLPNLTMCAEDRIRWYFIGMGDNFDRHSIYFHGQTVTFRNHREDTITAFPASLHEALMVAKSPGEWLVENPIYESMTAFFNVSDCQKSSARVTGTRVLHYYIAAEKILWNYAPSGINVFTGQSLTAAGSESQSVFKQGPTRIGGTYQKLVFRGYTDASFQTQKAREEHFGLIGPVIKAEVGDTIQVTFYNKGPVPLSMQPHGLLYSKDNEGSFYRTPGGGDPPASSHVNPGKRFVYTWQVPADVGPTSTDPNCLTWLYFSAVNGTKDTNSGLVGPLLVCRKGSLGKDGKQKGIDKEFYLLATVFDENQSFLLDENIRTFTTEPENVDKEDPDFQKSNYMSTLNGYMYGNQPGLDMCLGDKVSWHMFSVGSELELHGIYFSGNTFTYPEERSDTIPLLPHNSQTLLMTPDSLGKFDVVCLISQHYQEGMKNHYRVRQCAGSPPDQTRYQQEKVIYIAAEEVVWDYAPSRKWERELKRLQRENNTSIYLDKRETRLGSKYKKVVYRQYNDITFTKQRERNEDEKHLDILGPLIFATPGDKIRIIFKNKASRPFSIHAHGVKTQNSFIVSTQPGKIRSYVWEIPDRSGPTTKEFDCIPWFYSSTVDLVKDLNSGLVGPLVVCRKNVKARLVHRVLHFMIFDENSSWYFEENINTFSREPNRVDRSDFTFSLSNQMHAINGRLFGNNQGLTFHVGDEVNFYLLSMGGLFDMHTVHFHGHSFEYTDSGLYRSDVYDLPPGVYKTVKMYPKDVGTWLFHCHVSGHITDGMESTYTVIP
ncbi:ceruloplasmin-like [Saccopteryx bilineata]|uniref:ceruloplasmin-like n=1 Tax=Saccopteryx bilineata TaxID=59482 RepID=UPI00338D37C1